MDAAANPDEVRLRKGSSLSERLVWAGSGGAVLLIVTPGLVYLGFGQGRHSPLRSGQCRSGIPDRRCRYSKATWSGSSRPTASLIGEQRPIGTGPQATRSAFTTSPMSASARADSAIPEDFSLRCRLASGDVLVSPPLPDITQRRTKPPRRLRGCLTFLIPHSSTIRSMPPTPRSFLARRSVSMSVGSFEWPCRLLAALCSLPFLVAFGIGESELALGLLLPLGLIVAIALYRYTHRLSGTRWIVRHGDIRIERISWNGRLFAETIRSGDVAGDRCRQVRYQGPDLHRQHPPAHGPDLPQPDQAR